MHKEKAIIFSAPSGSGKTTIVKNLIERIPQLQFSISACTRDKRGREEVSGKDYYFLSQDEFKSKIDNQEFIEWEEVYPGNFYGTLKSEISRIWSQARIPIFDVDVKGGINLKNYFKEAAISIFVQVPSLDELKIRLHDRKTENDGSLSQRLYKATFEMKFMDKFDEILMNYDLDAALNKAEKMVRDFIES